MVIFQIGLVTQKPWPYRKEAIQRVSLECPVIQQNLKAPGQKAVSESGLMLNVQTEMVKGENKPVECPLYPLSRHFAEE